MLPTTHRATLLTHLYPQREVISQTTFPAQCLVTELSPVENEPSDYFLNSPKVNTQLITFWMQRS